MNPLEQTNGYKGDIICLLQLGESLKESVGILSWCCYIISFSFGKLSLSLTSDPLRPHPPFVRIGSFPLLWNVMVSTCPSLLLQMIDKLLRLTEVGAVERERGGTSGE